MNLFTFKGIPVRLHGSFLIFTGILAILNGMSGGLPAAINVVVAMIILFLSVVVHEFGHALMGKAFGVKTLEIIMTPLGGLALLDKPMDEPRAEIYIALAGPAVNLVLVGMFAPLLFFTSSNVLLFFISINLMLAFFNLLPAFPMDGGRVLRSVLARKYGWQEGTFKALTVSKFCAFAFIIVGALYAPMMAIIGIFLLLIVSQHQRQLRDKW